MKIYKRKGFTLVELLAVIVILGIIMTIATTSVIKNINDSKEKAKYIAAKEIVEMSEAYFATSAERDENGKISDGTCVEVETMIAAGYIESDVTNPENGENRSSSNKLTGQKVCKSSGSSDQTDYKAQDNKYNFDGYYYKLQ